MSSAIDVFRVKDGSMVDLPGLQAVAETTHRVLQAYSSHIWPEKGNIVLCGLEPDGQRTRKKGIPGGMRFGPDRFNISPGVAILADVTGQRHVLNIKESQNVVTGEPIESKNLRSLVICLDTKEVHDNDGDLLSYQIFKPEIKFLPRADAAQPHYLPLAHELAPRLWATDTCRLLRPDHEIIQYIFKEMDELEEIIWNSDRHGEPWKKRRLGREWKTYQTKASVAVSCARLSLGGRSSTSADRAQLLTNLHWQLQRSVQNAAEQIEKWLGIPESAGVYASVFSAFPENWDEM